MVNSDNPIFNESYDEIDSDRQNLIPNEQNNETARNRKRYNLKKIIFKLKKYIYFQAEEAARVARIARVTKVLN